MNTLIQNILVFVALGFALLFLIRKFFLKKSKSKNKVGEHDCNNCH